VLTPEEVGRLYRLSAATVRGHIKHRGLLATRLYPSGRYLIAEGDAEAFYRQGAKPQDGKLIDVRAALDEVLRKNREKRRG
jgi:hypothetical protein